MSNTYTCYHCKGTFNKTGWSDEEALKETAYYWGKDYKVEDCECLCDVCQKEFIEWMTEFAKTDEYKEQVALGAPEFTP